MLSTSAPRSDDKSALRVIKMSDLSQPANDDDRIEETTENATKHNSSLQESQDACAVENAHTGSRSKLRLATVMLALYVSLPPQDLN